MLLRVWMGIRVLRCTLICVRTWWQSRESLRVLMRLGRRRWM